MVILIINIYTFEKGKTKPTMIAHSWQAIIELGWIFAGLEEDNKVVMTRNGYINKFWAEEVSGMKITTVKDARRILKVWDCYTNEQLQMFIEHFGEITQESLDIMKPLARSIEKIGADGLKGKTEG